MKALTIKQPWASLIARGVKDIENRTWRTKFRGRIYIHASTTPVTGSYKEILPTGYWTGLAERERSNLIYHFQFRGAIIGEVDIIDCVINHESIWAEKTKGVGIGDLWLPDYNYPIIYNWVLANPVLYDTPILNVKGKLSFWEYSVNAP
jgi:hypothetical protein